MTSTINPVAPATVPSAPAFPQYQLLPLRDLHCTTPYQQTRRANAQFNTIVKKIVKNFDVDLFGCLSVVIDPRGGYEVWDGQARQTAASQLGFTLVPCLVGIASAERQAQLFVKQEDRRAVTPYDKHVAKVSAGDQIAIAIDGILTGVGLSLSNQGGKLTAVRAVESVYEWGVEGKYRDLLHDTFSVIEGAWAGKEGRYRAQVIVGVARFLRDNVGKVNVPDVTAVCLANYVPTGLFQEAKALQNRNGGTGYGILIEIATILTRAYNKDMKSRLRLP